MGWSQFCVNEIWSCEKGVMCDWGGSHVKVQMTKIYIFVSSLQL